MFLFFISHWFKSDWINHIVHVFASIVTKPAPGYNSYNPSLANDHMSAKFKKNRSKNHLQTIIVYGFIIVILALNSSAILSASADSINPAVYSIDSKPYGMSYGEWTGKWWQWLLSEPQASSPATDQTGKNCGQNQNGPVWFLAGTAGGSATRTCTIPAGKAILFGVINAECSYSERPTLKTEPDLAQCAKLQNAGTTNLQASLDGMTLQQLDKYRVTSPIFNLTFPTNNIFGSPVGTTQAVADGWYVFLHPLTPGKHELHFSGLHLVTLRLVLTTSQLM
jgi:hypothetical protein